MSKQLKHHIDNQLSGLSWSAKDIRRTLRMMQSEAKTERRLSLGIVFTIALLMAVMAVAVAEIVRFSVREYQALNEPVAQQHITPIGQEIKTGDVIIYLTDAVFNGQEMYVAFEAESISGQTVYLLPALSAKSGGKALDYHVFGSQGLDFRFGFWVPDKAKMETNGKYGMDVRLPMPIHEAVEWELSFTQLKPLWPTVDDISGYSDDNDDSIDYDVWEKQFADAYDNQQIMLVHGSSILMFEPLLPPGPDLAQRMIASGAFEKTGQMKSTWTSPYVQNQFAALQETIIEDGFEVQIEKLELSFMSLNYQFTVRITDPQQEDKLFRQDQAVDYLVSSPGSKMRYVSSSIAKRKSNDGQIFQVFSGLVNYSGEMPSSLVFTPYTIDEAGQYVYKDWGIFKIDLQQ